MLCVVVVVFVTYYVFFFFKQKTAYEMRISDWSSDVCSSDLVAVIVNEFRRGRTQRFFAYLVPKTCEIIKIAFDLRLGPLKPCRQNDAAHGVGQFQLRNDRLETLAISRVIDLARNTAPMDGIRLQNAISAGKAQIAGRRTPFL